MARAELRALQGPGAGACARGAGREFWKACLPSRPVQGARGGRVERCSRPELAAWASTQKYRPAEPIPVDLACGAKGGRRAGEMAEGRVWRRGLACGL